MSNISTPRTRRSDETSLLMYFAVMPARKKLICLTTFLLVSAWGINTLFDPQRGDEMYGSDHLTRAKNRPAIDLSNIEQLKKEAKETIAKAKPEPTTPTKITEPESDNGDDDDDDDDAATPATKTETTSPSDDAAEDLDYTVMDDVQTPLFEDDKYADDIPYDDYNPSTAESEYYDDDDMDDIVSDYISLFRAADIEEQLQSVSDKDALHDWMAPQGRAFQWLVNQDERMINANDPYLLQRYVLATLYYATNGVYWDNEGLHWMSLLHECYWNKKVKGRFLGVVECDEDKFVTRIDLAETNLLGNLPPEIGLLKSLKQLNLNSNRIDGSLPSTIGFLQNLTRLSLDFNRITGTIPNKFHKLSKLSELKINHNDVTGTVPKSVCNLRDESLYLLWTDCEGDPPAVKCECCTECCDGLDLCYSQIDLGGDYDD